MSTQPDLTAEAVDTVAFFVRLRDSDWEPETASWRCPALDLPGSTIKDIYSSGNRVDVENYRIIEHQSHIRWSAGTKPPEQITALVSVDSKTKHHLNKEKEIAEKNELWWKRFGIIVPIVVAIISGFFASFKTNQDSSHVLKITSNPTNSVNRPYGPTLKINGSIISTPFQTDIRSDTAEEIDFGAFTNLLDSTNSIYARNKEISQSIFTALDAIDSNVSQASSRIVDSCSGGPHGTTPANGQGTMDILAQARNLSGKIRQYAASLPIN